MTLFWCSSWLYIRQILKSSQVIEDAGILNLVATQAKAYGLKKIPIVRASNQVPIGATVGWNRVHVLLHTDYQTWTEQERSAVIAHELAHAVRHDFIWVIIASWTRILLFFHPLVHLLIHRLRMEQELAADQLAAGKVGNAKTYGRALASLALRSQQSLGGSQPQLSSMLAAGQICVTRRVMMLKQGSFKTVQTRLRWSAAIVIAIACCAGPVAGLRGTAQEPLQDAKPIAKQPDKEAKDEEQNRPVPKPLSEEFLEAFPPLEFQGSVVYRPGRLRAGEFGPAVAWVQESFNVAMLGRPMPDNAVIHAECTPTLRWLDEAREHGAVVISADFREGESTVAGQLEKLSGFPSIFPNMVKPRRVVSTQELNGRTISGIARSANQDQPEQWLVDDDQGYFLGSLADAKRFILGRRFALDGIPEAFRDDYEKAAFAIVFDNCESWYERIETYTKGSKKEAEFQIVMQFIEDAKHIGLFVDGCNSPACTIRAAMADESAAKRLATQSRALIEMAKLAMNATEPTPDSTIIDTEVHRSFIQTVNITTHNSEVHFQFDIFSPTTDDGSALSNLSLIEGWQNVNSYVELHEAELPFVELTPSDVMPTFPSLFSQTLDARNYCGKNVCLDLEIQCNEEGLHQAGLFIWASRHEAIASPVGSDRKPIRSESPYVGHRLIAARTIACDGASTLRHAWETPYSQPSAPDDNSWRKVSLQFDVPRNAQHLSFGCYSKKDIIRLRQANLRTKDPRENSPQTVASGHDALADIAYNFLVVPGQSFAQEPINLNFSNQRPEHLRQASQSGTKTR